MEEGWEWMGESQMFKDDEDDFENDGDRLAMRNGGEMNSYNNKYVVYSLHLKGNKAEKFMDSKGYEFKPTQQIRCESEVNFYPESGTSITTGDMTYITEKSRYLPKGTVEDEISPTKPNNLLYMDNHTVNRFQITYTTNFIKRTLNSLMPFMGYHDFRIPMVYSSLKDYPWNNKYINIFLRTKK